MGAGGAAMRIMDQRMYNEMRNKTNRLSNCETANISKSVNAAVQVQLAIEKLQAAGALNTLPETLRHTARLRMQYPDLPHEEDPGGRRPSGCCPGAYRKGSNECLKRPKDNLPTCMCIPSTACWTVPAALTGCLTD